jgi:hypothetical protein
MIQNTYIIIIFTIFPTLAILAFITSLINYSQNSRARLRSTRILQALGEEHAIMLLTMQGLVRLGERYRRDIDQLRDITNVTRTAAGRRDGERSGRSDVEGGDDLQHFSGTSAATRHAQMTTRTTRIPQPHRRDSRMTPSEYPHRLRSARSDRARTASPNGPNNNNFGTPPSPLLVTDALLSHFSRNSSTLTELSSTSSFSAYSTDPPSVMRTATSPTPSELSGDTLVGSDSYESLSLFAVRGRALTTAEEMLLRSLEVEVREWDEGWRTRSGRGDEDSENEAGRGNEQSTKETHIDGRAAEV